MIASNAVKMECRQMIRQCVDLMCVRERLVETIFMFVFVDACDSSALCSV